MPIESDPDDVLARAEAQLARGTARARAATPRARAVRRRRRQAWRAHATAKLMRMLVVVGVILLAFALFAALVAPLGILGTMAAASIAAAAALGLAIWPRFPEPGIDDIAAADLPQLADRTELWLEAQRPALPAPAQGLVDRIGVQLDLIGPQLARLDGNTPLAHDVRKLLGDDLTALVSNYQQVPVTLRQEVRGGRTADQQLVDGLGVLERELAQTGRALATGNMDQLATRSRYLELKYQGAVDEGQ